MNPQTHRVIFNKSRGCMMVVSEMAGSTTSGKSNKSSRSRKSRPRRSNHPDSSLSSLLDLNLSNFYLSNTLLAQLIRARAAIYSIVKNNTSTLLCKNLAATGAGTDSNVLIQGSSLNATNNVTFQAT